MSRIETGPYPVHQDHARWADAALGADGALLAIYEAEAEPAGTPAVAPGPTDPQPGDLRRQVDALTLRVDVLFAELHRHHPESGPHIPAPRDPDTAD